MEITRGYARFIGETGYEQLGDDVVTAAKRAVLDTLAATLAGSVEPAARIALELARALGGSPQATVIGAGERVSVAQAALVNGVSGHALDYDDVNYSLNGHPSVPVLPAVLALAEHLGASGRAALRAFVLGFEIECKLGRAQGASHYARGWHATSTHGTVGAAAAAAALLSLTEKQTVMALGIAGSMAAGSRQNFGTMTKPLHPGRAAEAGVTAALLAQRGFTADETMLEAPLGFIRLFSPAEDHDPTQALGNLGAPWDILAPGIAVKKYPCCYNTHRALDGVLALRDEAGIAAEDVAAVEILLPETSAAPLIHPRPQTGLEGKFSMQYCVAAALLDGAPRLATFSDAAVQRPAAQALLRRVEMRAGPAQAQIAGGRTEVALTLRDGRTLRRGVDEPRGSGESPLSWEELAEKFRDCAAVALPAAAAREALERIAYFESLPDLRGLMALLAAPERVGAAS
ncbi:MAG TPA: MmgE/PrpD family protein [Dehalococcoidia bacterium]|nr:MmgE/PrpD family protein [Dehalococcoidia bacterium]